MAEDASDTLLARLRKLVGGMRVVPQVPPGRAPRLPEDDPDEERADDADDDRQPGTLAAYITYMDARGAVSERRVTVRQVTGKPPDSVLCFCHERRAVRRFKIDRITEAIDVDTGEVLDVGMFRVNLENYHIPQENRPLRHAINVLVFLAKCDGRAVAAEWEAVEDALRSWCHRFDGDDVTYERAVRSARRSAPDAEDFLRGLRYLAKDNRAPKLAGWLRLSAQAIIDADGAHHRHELTWAAELDGYLQVMEQGQ